MNRPQEVLSKAEVDEHGWKTHSVPNIIVINMNVGKTLRRKLYFKKNKLSLLASVLQKEMETNYHMLELFRKLSKSLPWGTFTYGWQVTCFLLVKVKLMITLKALVHRYQHYTNNNPKGVSSQLSALSANMVEAWCPALYIYSLVTLCSNSYLCVTLSLSYFLWQPCPSVSHSSCVIKKLSQAEVWLGAGPDTGSKADHHVVTMQLQEVSWEEDVMKWWTEARRQSRREIIQYQQDLPDFNLVNSFGWSGSQ